MSVLLKDALAAVAWLENRWTTNGRLTVVRSALEAAQQDAEAFETYGRAHRVLGPSIWFTGEKWVGNITEQFESMCDGDSYAEVHSKLATWCRAEMTK